ncbi:uncharacterized protein N7500_010202 [Penicillium coprophilum]|uniref:uncharacterized protein n=1 Tax=Penicillium coprophilum TaxID=36646 RepID=UPI00238BDF7C|nr:uncharacterized protein N7500_010202 [Penicillium coprophilum]KAJ5154763.1 hypothetical protein N7500_010202 [Penicillium coprophilum]
MMSFGYSLGDFLAILKLANDLRKQFRDAPIQYKEVADDVRKLSNVLRVIEDYKPDHSLSDQQTESLKVLSQNCGEVLKQLRGTLERYSHVMGADHSTKVRIQRAWKKITWDSKEAIYFHEKIDSEITHFSLFLNETILQVVRETRSMVASCTNGVNQMLKFSEDKKRLKMLNWLSSKNNEVTHAKIWNDRHENTGQWFLDTDRFRKWLAQDSDTPQDERTLFCFGDEGAGKTFISAIVVEELRRHLESHETVKIAFFYCEFQERPTIDAVLASLLRQLLQENMSPLSGLESLFGALEKKQRRPTENELFALLDSAVSPFSRVFFVVDAIDECRWPGEFAENLKNFCGSLQRRQNLGLLVTSRSIPSVQEIFQNNPRILVRAHEDDISTCLESGLRGFRAIRATPELQSEVISTITKSADGIVLHCRFLLVGLHLESLQGWEKATAKLIRDKLKSLPTTLENAYRERMARIENQPPFSTKIARLVLAWIVWATKPLRSIELRHALATALGEDSFHEENLLEIDDIISMCAGMIAVDEQSGIVQLRHYTRYEFFKNNWTEFFPDAHGHLANTCISYLRHETLQFGLTTSQSQFQDYLERFPLFQYAAKNWGYHARISYSEVKDSAQGFVQSENAILQSLRILFPHRYNWRSKQQSSITTPPLHPAAYFGLTECLRYFLAKNLTCDALDDYGQSALHWAAQNGQVEAAELLLNHGLGVNWADKEGKTALHYAADQDELRLITLLVRYKADMEYTDMDGETPLLTAVKKLKLEPAQELVNLGASIEATDSCNRSALHLSAIGGNHSIRITKFLLARGACSEICDVENMIPMHYAIRNGSTATVEALIQAGACVNHGILRKRWHRTEGCGRRTYELSPNDRNAHGPKTSHGLTPLHWAALIGDPKMVQYLLSKGADPNKCCQDGQTPLHLAIQEDIDSNPNDAWASPAWRIEILSDLVEAESEEANDVHRRVFKIRSNVLEILISDPSTDVNLQDEQLQAPLHLIASGRGEPMVYLSKLMNKKPNISIRNRKGQTPLHLASRTGKFEMVKELLAAGASVEVLDNEGLSPLQYCIRSGKSFAAVVGLFLKYYNMARLNPCTQTDGSGRNILHHYLREDGDSKKLIRTLLKHGADVNKLDKEGNSPLSLYLRSSDLKINKASICRFLLKKGASVLWSDESGRNLAHISMLAYPWTPHDEVILILKNFGVNVKAKDVNGRGITHYGAMNGSITQGIIDMLEESGSQGLHDRDNCGRTPLSYAQGARLHHQNDGFRKSRWESAVNVLVKCKRD